jgi:flagellar biosynthesis/type III secretory pathway chaperone
MDCRTNSRVEGLVTIIRNQAILLQSLLALTEEVQEHLIAFDATAIERCTRHQEKLLERFDTLERERVTTLADILNISTDAASQLTLHQLCHALDEPARSELMALSEEFHELIKRLQRANGINRLLALRGRNSIHSTLEFVRERNIHAINTAL